MQLHSNGLWQSDRMSARTAGRAAAAHLWRFKRPLLSLVILLPSAGALYEGFRNGDFIVAAIATLVLLLLGVAVDRLAFSKLPNGRDVTTHYLELATVVDAHPHDQLLRYKDSTEAVLFLCRHQGPVRGFLRLNFNDVELPQIDQEGWISAEDFLLVPGSNLVLQTPTACMIDDDGAFLPATKDPTVSDSMKGTFFRFRTGHGFAATDTLRDLVRQVRQAVPFKSEAP